MFETKDFLRYASKVDYSSDEAARRSAIHAAYYSLYHVAMKYAVRHLGFRRRRGSGDHTRLHEHFLEQTSEELCEIGDALVAAKTLRVSADYNPYVYITPHDVDRHIENCLQTVQQIEQLRNC